ncbi:hypothetical protein D3C71_1728030 [compost metagenome]
MGSTSDSVTASPALPLTIICTRPSATNWLMAPLFITSASDSLSVLLPVPVRSMISTELTLPASAVRSSVWLAPVSLSVSAPPLPEMAESDRCLTSVTTNSLLSEPPCSVPTDPSVSVCCCAGLEVASTPLQLRSPIRMASLTPGAVPLSWLYTLM